MDGLGLAGKTGLRLLSPGEGREGEEAERTTRSDYPILVPIPPSTRSTSPVMNWASSEARNRAA